MTSDSFIPYGRQSISEDDIESVIKVLRSNYLTQGPIVTQFENALCKQVQADYAVAANSATSALHIACLALGVGPGDTVWTSPNSFIASANCARYCGADVDFVDINPQTYNLCAQSLAKKLETAQVKNKLPKVVIPVHFAGQSCDMRAIKMLADQYGFAIIEDASHAIGGRYQDHPVGSCHYSDITVFSFHPVKIITSAEGGAALTNNRDLAISMQCLVHQGVTRIEQEFSQASPGDWYYEQQTLGFNYRMTELQAALGLSQLTRLDEFVQRRQQILRRYEEGLKDIDLVLPYQAEYASSALHLFPVLLPHIAAQNKGQFFSGLRQSGIGTQVHYIPIHTQPYYQALGFRWGDFPEAEHYYQRTITLPLFPELTEVQQDKVMSCIKGELEKWIK